MPLVRVIGVPETMRNWPTLELFAYVTIPNVVASIDELELTPADVSTIVESSLLDQYRPKDALIIIVDGLFDRPLRTKAVKDRLCDGLGLAGCEFLRQASIPVVGGVWRNCVNKVEVWTRTLDTEKEGMRTIPL